MKQNKPPPPLSLSLSVSVCVHVLIYLGMYGNTEPLFFNLIR